MHLWKLTISHTCPNFASLYIILSKSSLESAKEAPSFVMADLSTRMIFLLVLRPASSCSAPTWSICEHVE